MYRTGRVRLAMQSVSLSGLTLSDDARCLLEALEDAAAWFDPQGVLLYANRALTQWVGRACAQLQGLSSAEWRALLAEGFVLPEEAPPLDAASWQVRLQTRSFPRRYLHWEARPLATPGGEALGRLELLRDVTESVRAEEERSRLEAQRRRELEALEARLEAAEKFKLELTANVTHDLRTPIASIKASVSGLLAGDVDYDPAALRETLQVIEEEADRLQRRVQNLLSMARMEAGDVALNRDWVDVTDVVASALESLRSIRGSREVRLQFGDELPLVLADYDQLQIAVRNLLENAMLYSPPDTPVEVSAVARLGQLYIRVRDYGPGLLPDEFERVFEKFYRGRAARKIPGTGLGLPICRGIAEAHGGRLWVEHEPTGGAAFVLALPLADAPEPLDGAAPLPKPRAARNADGEGDGNEADSGR